MVYYSRSEKGRSYNDKIWNIHDYPTPERSFTVLRYILCTHFAAIHHTGIRLENSMLPGVPPRITLRVHVFGITFHISLHSRIVDNSLHIAVRKSVLYGHDIITCSAFSYAVCSHKLQDFERKLWPLNV